MNVGFEAAASDSVTPDGAVQLYVNESRSASELALPSSVTVAPSSTCALSTPATATGAALAAGSTVTRTSSRPVLPPGSATLRRNFSTFFCFALGAVNVAVAVAAPCRSMSGPPRWIHS